MTANLGMVAGDRISVDVHTTGNRSGVLFFKAVAGAAATPDNGAQIDHDSLDLHFQQNFLMP